ncbi:phenylacetate--CoA ligase family protein [Virgibacillus sp. SK37]|uniref:phenylacetate--CoA ligase family protein n=1 Tax=Virgibacillus sp. SK37 TaxID=403957 RepID=UPI0004D193D2|nr:phenylacetate--CoA ligase family protein [Virgibacillus sp. SK37]AIF45572.1 hypothetical protein X953_16540 [Virgibacillus sp. SK37]
MDFGLSKIRNQAFWLVDKLKGGNIRDYYNNLKRAEEIDSFSPLVREKQKKAIEQLIQHSISSTNYYNRCCNGLDFEHFPIINKNIIRNRQNEFISNIFKKDQLITMHTSGSTGTPFISYQNVQKKKRVIAELIYYNEKLGYFVGKNLIFLRSLTAKNKGSKLLRFLQNLTLINVFELNDNAIDSMLKKIERKSSNGSVLMSYASTLDAFRDYFNQTNRSYSLNVTGIISGSEMLYDDTREVMENVFQCKCISRYSNQENGVLGQDDVENNVFLINEAHYLIEIFKIDEDVLAAEGEVGRIVITDLYNYAMPMIRYDTGDIGAITYVDVKGIKKKCINNFGGRKIDMVYKVDGSILSPHKISVTFWSFTGINQFQFIQLGPRDYKVVLNVASSFNSESQIVERLYKLLGETAEIRFSYVEDIPALSSGKRKYIMNKWEK